jgi:hypothetical protein
MFVASQRGERPAAMAGTGNEFTPTKKDPVMLDRSGHLAGVREAKPNGSHLSRGRLVPFRQHVHRLRRGLLP